jgi:3-oxoacyl-[acyl-carrier-protein] synthase III
MKCKTCGESIVIFGDGSGAVYILDKPKYGYTDIHYCGNGDYGDILSPSAMKRLGVSDKK